MSKDITRSLLQSFSEALIGIAADVSPAVVRVSSCEGVGSGTIWNEDGFIVTCCHLVGGAGEVEVAFKEKTYGAQVVGSDRDSDLALLKIEAKGLQTMNLGDSDDLKVGQLVIAVANPTGKQPGLTTGMITSRNGSFHGMWGTMSENMLLTDARVNPGYSGGPLVDAEGKMIGLDVGYVARRGISVPVNRVKTIVKKLAQDGRIKKAYLGIVSHPIAIPDEIVKEKSFKEDRGLIVLSVEPKSPAKVAGLLLGDVIVKMNDSSVASIEDLRRELSEESVGVKVKLSILRSEKLIELMVTPVENIQ